MARLPTGDDVELVVFLAEVGELAHLPGEAVDAVDEQEVGVRAGEVERFGTRQHEELRDLYEPGMACRWQVSHGSAVCQWCAAASRPRMAPGAGGGVSGATQSAHASVSEGGLRAARCG